MRILYLSTWFPYPPDNGSKLRAFYLAKSLCEQHEVTIVAFRPQPTEGSSSILVAQNPVVAVSDDPFRYVSLPPLAKYLSRSPVAFRPSRAMQQAVDSLAHQGTWDAVVAVQMSVAQYAVRVPTGCRIIDVDTAMTFQLHDRFQLENRRLARASHWVSWQKAQRYERDMLRQFHCATVVWQAEADFLRKIANNSGCAFAVIPNGVDTVHNRFASVEPCYNTLVYSGSLTYSANFDAMRWFLADVYPLIRSQQPDVHLTITGSIKGVDLSQLPLNESVRLTGFVDDVRVPVGGATICVVPIRQGSGTRTKILESMALGTAVVSTTKGAEGLDVVDGEHLLLADTPEDFARATLYLLANAEKRAQISCSARRLVEANYDWSQVGGRFVNLVEESTCHCLQLTERLQERFVQPSRDGEGNGR